MTVEIDTRSVESSVATEIYISAMSKESAPAQHQAQEIFSRILDVLQSKNAHILQERVFATLDVMGTISRVRSEVYADVDDGVAPSFLAGKDRESEPLVGVQVYAISCDSRPEVIDLQGRPCGRVLHVPSGSYLTLSDISAAHSSPATEQARAALKKAELALRQFDADFLSVPRTWMWLGDILAWYDDFNRVRTEFFTDRGLIGEGTRQSMPASTGIGLACADGSKCAMDLVAVLQPPDSTRYLQAVGKQQCALEYGSAFSRASRAPSPAGQTVFVSGTASIDAGGTTTNVGDARGQINTTIENIRAVLRDTQTADEDVVQAVAYCKTTEVEKIFNDVKIDLAWPCVTVLCDICRPDLLFEMEATAMAVAKSE